MLLCSFKTSEAEKEMRSPHHHGARQELQLIPVASSLKISQLGRQELSSIFPSGSKAGGRILSEFCWIEHVSVRAMCREELRGVSPGPTGPGRTLHCLLLDVTSSAMSVYWGPVMGLVLQKEGETRFQPSPPRAHRPGRGDANNYLNPPFG